MGFDKREADRINALLPQSLAELELSVRATNCLESEGVASIRDLVVRVEDELLEVRNFGETTLQEVKEKLKQHGLHLGMKLRRGGWLATGDES